MNTTKLTALGAPIHIGMDQPAENLGMPLWFWWTTAHAGCAMLGVTINRYAFNGTQLAFVGLMTFLMLALTQERLVRRYLPGIETGKWLLVTITSAVLGLFLGTVVTGPLSVPGSVDVHIGADGTTSTVNWPSLAQAAMVPTLGCAVLGLTVGVMQVIVLKRYVTKRFMAVGPLGTWAWLNAVACAAAGCSAFLVLESSRRSSIEAGVPQSNELALQATAFLVGLTILGIISGVAADRILPKVFRARNEATLPAEEKPPAQVLVVLLWLVAAVYGSFWLWISYHVVQQAFQGPWYHVGPGGPGYDWDYSPVVFFLQSRVLAGGMLLASIAFLVLMTVVSLRANHGSQDTGKGWWYRYWSVVLMSFLILTVFNFVGFVVWFVKYMD